jgi:hypothetical protein
MPQVFLQLKRFSPLNDSYQHHHDCDDNEDMDKAAKSIAAYQPQHPEYHEYHKDRPEHSGFLSGSRSTAFQAFWPNSSTMHTRMQAITFNENSNKNSH